MTGPLAPLFAQLESIAQSLDAERLIGSSSDLRETAAAIERHTQDTAEDVQQIVSALPGHPHGRDPISYAKDVARHVQDMEKALEQIMDHIEENDWDIPGTFHSYAQNKSASLVWIRDVARAALPARGKEEE